MFCSKYKRKNPNYVLDVFVVLCVESLVRSRGYQDQDNLSYVESLHTHLRLSRLRFKSKTW